MPDLIIKRPAYSLYVLRFLRVIDRFIEVPELTRGFQFVFLRNQEGSQIAEEGKEKQYDANGEQGVVMAAPERRFSHLSNDGSRHGPDRIKKAFRDECRTACNHKYDHGLADDAA